MHFSRDGFDFIEFVPLVNNDLPTVLPDYALQPAERLSWLSNCLKEVLLGQTALSDAWVELG
jgi:hypothetical protein